MKRKKSIDNVDGTSETLRALLIGLATEEYAVIPLKNVVLLRGICSLTALSFISIFMAEIKQKFGKRLRYLRRQKDLTQEQLAEKVGISVEFLSNLERGINGPSFETLEKLSVTLEVELKNLFDFDEK